MLYSHCYDVLNGRSQKASFLDPGMPSAFAAAATGLVACVLMRRPQQDTIWEFCKPNLKPKSPTLVVYTGDSLASFSRLR